MKILLSGANFINKGAEAMLFIAANECFTRFPGAECIVQLPEGFALIRSMEELYELSTGARKVSDHKVPQGGIKRKLHKVKALCSAYKSADAMLDLSGYELSSKLGVYPSLRYLFKIRLSKHYHTQVYLMPQSFGPFRYRGIWKLLMPWMIRRILKHPIVCFARETEGEAFLQEIAPRAKVRSSCDLVLQNKNINAVKDQYAGEIPFVEANSVGFVPNRRLIEQGTEEDTMACFRAAVAQIRQQGKKVYLICHAADDMSISEQIKTSFAEDDGVVVVSQILSCFAYQSLSRHFDYVVAARYHSIVHAYKEGTPVVALGWAVKYKELLGMFGQEAYLVEVKAGADEVVRQAISSLDGVCAQERERIIETLSDIQSTNCFDVIEIKEKK